MTICSNWGIAKHGVPQGSILGPLLFLLYIKALPQIINSQSKPILFTDDTSTIICHPDSDYFQNSINDIFADLNWFKANKLTLNFDKTNFMKFTTNNKTSINFNIGYDDRTTEEVLSTKFLGLQIDNNKLGKAH
jgi:hypothetical protein